MGAFSELDLDLRNAAEGGGSGDDAVRIGDRVLSLDDFALALRGHATKTGDVILPQVGTLIFDERSARGFFVTGPYLLDAKDRQMAVADVVAIIGLKSGQRVEFTEGVLTKFRRLQYHARQARKANELWAKACPARGTIVEAYLRSRGIELATWPDALRFSPAAYHPVERHTVPAMVALISNAVTGEPQGVHLTALKRDGCGKAAIDPDKWMHGKMLGGVIRLAPVEVGPLMIGEGIETCLSAMMLFELPAWAAMTCIGLYEALALPADVRDVIILVDGDDPGRRAAAAAWRRWKDEGRRVRLRYAPQGKDFNDIVMANR
jgi:hypothetical protein